jgi:hypothetical protein
MASGCQRVIEWAGLREVEWENQSGDRQRDTVLVLVALDHSTLEEEKY